MSGLHVLFKSQVPDLNVKTASEITGMRTACLWPRTDRCSQPLVPSSLKTADPTEAD